MLPGDGTHLTLRMILVNFPHCRHNIRDDSIRFIISITINNIFFYLHHHRNDIRATTESAYIAFNTLWYNKCARRHW